MVYLLIVLTALHQMYAHIDNNIVFLLNEKL